MIGRLPPSPTPSGNHAGVVAGMHDPSSAGRLPEPGAFWSGSPQGGGAATGVKVTTDRGRDRPVAGRTDLLIMGQQGSIQ